jgi:catechol 2,3-dioxygenase-like lactoylglutathione lyase family enzyme
MGIERLVPMSIAAVVKGFHDVTIVAQNVAELRRFYAGLGFRQILDHGDELAVFLVGVNELAIHTSAAQPMNAIVLSVLVDDLEPVQRRAAELGIAIEAPMPMRPGLIGVALLDPNGNKLEFLQAPKT